MLFKRHISFFIIAALVLALFAGCKDKDADSKPAESTDTTTNISSSQEPDTSDDTETSEPDVSDSSVDSSSEKEPSSVPSSSSQSNEPHLHAYKITRIAPTCTSEGYTLYQCSCGAEKREDFLPAKGHTWGEWKVVQEPTFTEIDKKERSCTVCGVTESENIQKLSEDDFIDEILKLVNEQRKANNIAELSYRDDIQECADICVSELLKNSENTDLYNPDYSALLKEHGIEHSSVKGNIVVGSPDENTVISILMDSEESRNNILSTDFTGMAVGVAENDGTYYWVLLFIG